MAKDLPPETDVTFDSPSEFEVLPKKFWKETLTNNDFLKMYKRKGLAYRTLNKETDLMFKNGWTCTDQAAENIAKEMKFRNYAQYAHLNALVSGYCLIYINYGDDLDYSEEPPASAKAIGFYVVPRAWVSRDIKSDNKIYSTYEIYKADGSSFEVHKDRFIRVKTNKDEMSRLQPAYDSLTVLDNVIWGIGQTMFRSGSGFPVMKIKDATSIIRLPDGTNKTRMQYYKDLGFLRDINTQTGFMLDEKDNIDFIGAAGKALQPGEYYDKAFQQCAVDLDVPVDVLKGVAAGAITGSETNLKMYYGDLAAKQKDKLEPLYEEMFAAVNYTKDIEYTWKPIFEQTQKEIIENLKNDVDSIHKLELYGYFTHEFAIEYLAASYPTLNLDEKKISQLKNLPTYEKPTGFSISSSDKSNNGPSVSDDEETALPKKIGTIENKYRKEMQAAFKQTSRRVGDLLAAFNTD